MAIPAALFPGRLPASVPGEAVMGGSRSSGSSRWRFRLHPGPEPIDVVTWGVKPHMEDLFLSLYLSVSPYLSKQTFKKQD